MRNRMMVGFAVAGLITAAAIWLNKSGVYGWTLFAALPTLVGAAAVFVARPSSQWKAPIWGAAVATSCTLMFLVVGLEGLMCVAMALPVTVPFGALGGWLAHVLCNSKREAHGLALMVIVPLGTLSFDGSAKPELYKVETQLTVAAPPEAVWENVVQFSALAEPTEWYFKTGLAYPKRARIEGSGAGAIRYCEFSTGAFVEPIEVWDEPRLLQFRVTENPAPLHEWSPYGELDLKHLHGYMVSKRGQFQLERLNDGTTLLRGTTWYQHGLWPSEYWRWWSDAIIHRIHKRVLRHVKELAENQR